MSSQNPTPSQQLTERIRSALRRVGRPDRDTDVVSAGMIRRISTTEAGDVTFEFHLGPSDPSELASDVREVAAGVEGVESVRVQVRVSDPDEEEDHGAGATSAAPDRSRAESGDEPRDPERDAGRTTGRIGSGRSLPVMGQGSGSPGPGGGSDAGGADGPGDAGSGDSGGPRPTPVDREASSRHPSDAPSLPGVTHVVAVSSGKGGVGKSTIATNLAAAWTRMGHSVGLMDADIYGPDIPTMFGVHDKPRMAENEVIPLEAHGVKLMSIGFLVGEDTPAIWRGPIIMGVVRQFLQQVRWGELDYLVVDLPPGTGDAQLSLVQLVRVDGGVFVTTPQDVAVGGVLKGVKMFERLEVPVAGIVENMRGFVCPDCGGRHDIFGSGGGEKLAASLELPFLGAVPLGIALREEGDRGLPTVMGRPDSPEAEALMAVARETKSRLGEMARDRQSSEPEGGESDIGEPGEPSRSVETRNPEPQASESGPGD